MSYSHLTNPFTWTPPPTVPTCAVTPEPPPLCGYALTGTPLPKACTLEARLPGIPQPCPNLAGVTKYSRSG